MIPHLPPLQTLRAFEAAARHLNYTSAAHELHLTHGAVSHHISRLEDQLGGVKLFIRDGHRMLLTHAGQLFVVDVRQALMALVKAFEDASANQDSLSQSVLLNLSLLPAFAARWLIPRLTRFQAANPSVDIAVRPTAGLATLDARDGVDIAIRYGAGKWAGLSAELLLSSVVSAVCSPSLLSKKKVKHPVDLQKCVLLRNPRQKWRPWFAAVGIDAPEPDQGPLYDDAGLLLDAAALGHGVALARSALVADDLATGRLVELFGIQIADDYGWYLVWREPLRCDRAAFASFREWLMLEAGRGMTEH